MTGTSPNDRTGTDRETTPEADEGRPRGAAGDVLYRTTPTLRPTLIFLGASLFVGLAVVGYLFWNPTAVAGDEQLTGIVRVAVALLLVLIVVRLLIRLFVLRRTTYIVRSGALQREFRLLFRHRAREVPVHQVRGHEYSQNRIQALLGYGTIRMLTGGTNQSLGFVEFEDVPNPGLVREHVQELVARRRERSAPSPRGELDD